MINPGEIKAGLKIINKDGCKATIRMILNQEVLALEHETGSITWKTIENVCAYYSIDKPGEHFKIYLEKAGVISKEAVWCCASEGYLYISNTLENLIEILNTEWKNDKHLIG